MNSRSLFATVTIFFIAFLSNGQLADAPPIEWRSRTWAPVYIDGVSPLPFAEDTGEDWWYSHKNAYIGNQHVGYITCGYTTWPNTGYDEEDFDGCLDKNLTYINPLAEQLEQISPRVWFKGSDRQTIAFFDLNGNMIWWRMFNNHGLFEIIQVNDGYIAVGGTKSTVDFDGNPLYYNPSSNSTTDYFYDGAGCNFGEETKHMNIIKIDFQGNEVWNYIYGFENFNPSDNGRSAYLAGSAGYDIVQTATGYRAVGAAYDNLNETSRSFFVDIDNNGLIQENGAGLLSKQVIGRTSMGSIARGIWRDGNDYYICGMQYNSSEKWMAYVSKFDDNIPANSLWSMADGQRLISEDASKNEVCWDVTTNTQGNVLLPLVTQCSMGCRFDGDHSVGTGKVYTIDQNTGESSDDPLPPVDLGEIRAYDMKIGITSTSDGGFTVVSTKRNSPNPDPPSYSNWNQLWPPQTYINPVWYNIWGTDAFVARYSSNGALWWETVFDSHDNPPEPVYGDLKKQECLYHITEAQNGGFIISGNTSHNFDDNYLVKIADDCEFVGTVYDIEHEIYQLANDENWTTDRTVRGRIIIPNGITLTIDGAKVELADSRKNQLTRIEVQRGGRLIVKNGAQLTSIDHCPYSMWDGIFVEGNPSLSHGSENWHGVVEVFDSEISNARNGIQNFREANVATNEPNWSFTGGIIKAERSTFINNKRDIQIVAYPFNNSSYFKGCQFVTDGGLNNGEALLPHISIWNTDGIEIIGNSFENTSPITSNAEDAGTGIFIGKGDVIVSEGDIPQIGGSVTPNVPNQFKNLFIGVEYSLVGGVNSVTLNGNKFEDNIYGITLDGVGLVDAIDNEFKVPAIFSGFVVNPDEPKPQAYQTFGIYGNHVANFNIEQNSFLAGSGVHGGAGSSSYGVFIKNSNGDGDPLKGGNIYRNTFNGLKISNQYEEDNSRLQVDCNDYESIGFDLIVGSGTIEDQGVCPPANDPSNQIVAQSNTFTPQCSTNESVFIGQSANSFKYSFYSNYPLDVGCTNLNIPDQEDCLVNSTTGCPATYSNGTNIIVGQIGGIKNQIGNISDLIDGGDTGGLIASIENDPAGQVKNNLISASPYLSDEVLIKYCQSSPPAGHIKLVMLANSPLTYEVLTELNTVSLPNGIRNQINNAQTGKNPIAALNEQIKYLESQLLHLENQLVRTYFYNGEDQKAIDYINHSNTPEVLCALIPIKADRKEFSEVQSHLNYLDAYATQIQPNEPVKAERINEFCRFYQLIIDLQTRTNKEFVPALFDMTNAEESTIRAIASKEDIPVSTNAKNVLKLIYGEKYVRYALEVSPSQNRIGQNLTHSKGLVEEKTNEIEEMIQDKEIFKVYPNPFSNTFTVQVSSEANNKVVVSSVYGQILFEQQLNSNEIQFSMSEFPSGIYTVSLFSNDVIKETKRLIKLK